MIMGKRLVWSKTEKPRIQVLIPILIIFVVIASATLYAMLLYPENRLVFGVMLFVLTLFFVLSAILPEGP